MGPRALLALGAALLFAAPAWAEIPREDAAHCRGQSEIQPLRPLKVVTARGTFVFHVEVADTDQRREFGLMCRRALAPDRGMLFDFGAPQANAYFWMRNTLIPLDIVYIRPDGTVLSIVRNAAPLDESPLPSGGEVRWVLEIPGGRAAQIGLLPGDKIINRTVPA